ncbi:MAG: bifunctional methylenetetrahydrofolate dehydrogenase/methenyltetrahydrofolate cyclohydrolase [Candidatus Diapherotrites archaeon]|uniref:Bifunctional protein FolD n=1 Tax=Candidatus Iainarchaeum sp. TaxID=3101447 RepID=A0A2D6M177_9ARCH|nr:bifunctional methylenetetrahydrofolate dehydrogenase/methenyltetrahydrofolate cyclohydrolase [Candidatus Diapherotrites archaeon]|tara:strand:- start:4966 stop:5805 length:840 start_codon:yes stop_codon:yes gene_type:complete
MPAKLIDGKAIAEQVLSKVKAVTAKLQKKPTLAVVLVGDNNASELYVRKKQEACEKVGINSKLVSSCGTVSEEDILKQIEELNNDSAVNGILVQLPLPKQVDRNKVLEAISPAKDVDGFTAENLGKLALGIEEFVSCTASGIVKLIESTGTNLEGKNVCVVNHSIVVGRPLVQLLLNRNATVSVCHKFTKNLSEFTKNADVVVTAAGVPNLIKGDMIKQGAIVIDAGIIRDDKKLVGDIDFDSVKEIASHITPVPGGVGPMTVACLIENTLKAAKLQGD